MKDIVKKQVLLIILELAKTIRWNQYVNERYLHHTFSHFYQNRFHPIDLKKEQTEFNFHPEWPTFRKNKIKYSRYKKNKEKFYISTTEGGSPGFIDFAIGDYIHPNIGVEFKWKYSWTHKEIVYDFLKCLDNKNPFDVAISYNVIIRKENLSSGGNLTRLFNRMYEAYTKAADLLNDDVCDDSREIYLIVTEIGKNGRRHWYNNHINEKFIDGLPKI